MTADRISEILMEKLLAVLPLKAGDEVSVLVNGLGGTPRRSCSSSTAGWRRFWGSGA